MNKPQPKEPAWRIRARDGLPKLYSRDEWIRLCTVTKPQETVLGGLTRVNTEVMLFFWAEAFVGAISVRRIPGNEVFMARFTPDDQKKIAGWLGDFT